MSRWLAVAALTSMMVVVGCDKNKDDGTTMSSDPKKMSVSAKSNSGAACSAGECSKSEAKAK